MDNKVNPMLEGDYPYTSGATKSSGDCLYSSSKATNVQKDEPEKQ